MSIDAVAFRLALKKGLGRSMLMLRSDPDNPALRDALLDACIMNDVYDRQCESTRDGYLHRLISVSGQSPFFWDALRGRLGAGFHDDHDVAQIFAILCLIAAEDQRFDRQELRTFLQCASDHLVEPCMWALVKLDGIDGVLLGIHRIYESVVADLDGEGWLVQQLIQTLKERDGEEQSSKAVEYARTVCPELDRLMVLVAEKAPRPAPAGPKNYAEFKANVEAGRSPRTAWVRDADQTDIILAAQDMLAERDERRVRSYLRVFRERAFPLPAATLFPLTRHENPMIAYGAMRILGRIRSPEVRTAALDFLAAGRVRDALDLLQANYHSGDFEVIGRAIERSVLNDETCHRIGFSVLHLLEQSPAVIQESVPVLLWLYENEPCTLCRRDVVRRLGEGGALPGWMAEEVVFDAEPRVPDQAVAHPPSGNCS
ncbi:MAG: hypothetical protein PW843_09800 [Azospirillaceae bacterium]|nr:hypothetical protein [Azospirillaceae bacterium]